MLRSAVAAADMCVDARARNHGKRRAFAPGKPRLRKPTVLSRDARRLRARVEPTRKGKSSVSIFFSCRGSRGDVSNASNAGWGGRYTRRDVDGEDGKFQPVRW